jgi:hypothetical protein
MTRNQVSAERVQLRRERNQATVQAKMMENAQAGLGVFTIILGVSILWYVVLSWASLEPAFRIFSAAVGSAMCWFGILSVIRFSIDEVRDVYQWYRLQELVVDKEVKLQQAMIDIADLRKENRRLQSAVKTQEFNQASKGAREIVAPDKFATLRNNADDLLQRWAKGASYARDATQISRGDWEEAMRLLDSAGLILRGGPGNRQRTIEAQSLTQAQQKLESRLRTWEQFDGTNFTPR